MRKVVVTEEILTGTLISALAGLTRALLSATPQQQRRFPRWQRP